MVYELCLSETVISKKGQAKNNHIKFNFINKILDPEDNIYDLFFIYFLHVYLKFFL